MGYHKKDRRTPNPSYSSLNIQYTEMIWVDASISSTETPVVSGLGGSWGCLKIRELQIHSFPNQTIYTPEN